MPNEGVPASEHRKAKAYKMDPTAQKRNRWHGRSCSARCDCLNLLNVKLPLGPAAAAFLDLTCRCL